MSMPTEKNLYPTVYYVIYCVACIEVLKLWCSASQLDCMNAHRSIHYRYFIVE